MKKMILVIKLESTLPDQEDEDNVTDYQLFKDSLEDGSIQKLIGPVRPDGSGFPELAHLKIKATDAKIIDEEPDQTEEEKKEEEKKEKEE